MNKRDTNLSVLAQRVTIIIRTAGERTTDLCKKLIEEQGVKEQIFFTCETPFSAALRKSYEIGISEGRPWTFCVDADVFLRPHSIELLLSFAERQQQHVFEVQGQIYDKFYDGPREAGNHLYRTSFLSKALKFIPEEGVDIRPEKYVLEQMQKQGYPNVKFNHVVGLHDFEQYYIDIYRKSFIHAHKHLYFTEKMVPNWKKKMTKDKDFEVALNAFADGIRNRQDIFVDKNQSLYIEKFNEYKIQEKAPIDVESFDLISVENETKNKMNNKYESLESVIISNNKFESYLKGFQNKMNKYGIIKSLILNSGYLFLKIGRFLRDSVIKNRQ